MQLIVLGMHRSGTSLVARMLNLMGVYFGPEGIGTNANEENPKGFWERRMALALFGRELRPAAQRHLRLPDAAVGYHATAAVSNQATLAILAKGFSVSTLDGQPFHLAAPVRE